MSKEAPDAVVVGAGVIGLSIAWRVASRGLGAVVVDPRPAGGATRVAAGMLAPVTEAHYGEEDLLALNLESARRYPSFVAGLEALTGADTGYRTCGTLAVGVSGGDMALLEELRAFHESLGLPSTLLGARETRRIEPALAPGLRGGLLVEGDHQVDNRRLARALSLAAARKGVLVRRARVTEVRPGDRPAVVLEGGCVMEARAVVLAAGCWIPHIAGLPEGAAPPVRPVKGQILRLARGGGAELPARNLRGLVDGTSIYLVPRADGELVVGATVEEQGYDTTVTAGGVHDLLRDATRLWPGISELELVESAAGLRPGSPDNRPMIGPTSAPGISVATGHYRNGILLAPVTADAVASLLETGTVEAVTAPFTPSRFSQPAPEVVRGP